MNGKIGKLMIGEVARLKGVSIKALRYYDRIGILKPDYVNPENNYRYYSSRQLIMLDLILLFLDLGLPLKDFTRYADQKGEVDLSGILLLGEKRAREEMEKLQENLERLKRIEENAASMRNMRLEEKVYLRQIRERKFLTLPLTASSGETVERMILRLATALYLVSQDRGIAALYQSGVYYPERDSGEKPSVFLEVSERTRAKDVLTVSGGAFECYRYKDVETAQRSIKALVIGDETAVVMEEIYDPQNPDAYICEVQIPVSKV